MKPIDFRNATFASLQDRIEEGLRAAVLRAWQALGPGTTAEIAARSGISILSFRPRTTELFQLGYVTLMDDHGVPAPVPAGEGIYRARTAEEHLAWFQQQQLDAQPQRELALGCWDVLAPTEHEDESS